MAVKKLDGRDEFGARAKDELVRRVGMRCSEAKDALLKRPIRPRENRGWSTAGHQQFCPIVRANRDAYD